MWLQQLYRLEALQLGILVAFDDFKLLLDNRLWFLGTILFGPQIGKSFSENAVFSKGSQDQGSILHSAVDKGLVVLAPEGALMSLVGKRPFAGFEGGTNHGDTLDKRIESGSVGHDYWANSVDALPDNLGLIDRRHKLCFV